MYVNTIGGSFFVKYNKHYVATGIVSVGDTDCDVDKYMLYTKLSDFVAWIRDAIEWVCQNKVVVSNNLLEINQMKA